MNKSISNLNFGVIFFFSFLWSVADVVVILQSSNQNEIVVCFSCFEPSSYLNSLMMQVYQ